MDEEYEEIKFVYDLWNRNMDIFDAIGDKYKMVQNEDIGEKGYGFYLINKNDESAARIKVTLSRRFNEHEITVSIMEKIITKYTINRHFAIYTMKYEYNKDMQNQIESLDKRYQTMIKYTIDKLDKYEKDNTEEIEF